MGNPFVAYFFNSVKHQMANGKREAYPDLGG